MWYAAAMKNHALLAAFMLVPLASCENKVTAANYDKVQNGMSRGQVETILGPGENQQVSGVSISGAGVAGSSSGTSAQSIYVWKKGNLEMSVTFKDGKVVAKSRTP